ncbi:MAG: hypothetical protein CM1200mP1_08080 [Candidatus Neomarinimicrobiota bacterium]|nr:MAG: hypothetical protein CM1200mP1_08080 [Candidatus Neomarinimicrobiota bacterium]
MKTPQKVIPQSMLYGMIIIAILYIGSNFLYHAVIGLMVCDLAQLWLRTQLFHYLVILELALLSIMVIISAQEV